jgi:VWFA-related protein
LLIVRVTRLAAVLSLVAVGVAPAAASAQTLRRSMYVSVLNQAGAPVPDLGPSDFIIREDNVAREILRVGPADQPMQIALLVDNTLAARDYVRDMREALRQFVGQLTRGTRAKNQVAIIGVADRPTILTEYTSDPDQLNKGIDRIFPMPGSGAYLLEAIVDAINGLKRREAARPVIIAISTEGPELSTRYHDQINELLRDSGIAFHAVRLGRPAADNRDAMRERSIVLDEGTRNSGGRHDTLLTSMALSDHLKKVSEDLTNQYLVTYARPQSLIPPSHVTVSAKQADLIARGTPVRDQEQKERP